MKRWIIGLLLLGIVIPLTISENVNYDDEDYEIKRFHVQSRQLDGKSQCVETRRKRSPQTQSNEGYAAALPVPFEDYDEEDDLMDDEIEVQGNTEVGNQESAGLLIRESDLVGNAGILVIQNGQPSNSPLLFELRPVASNSKKYAERDNDNRPDAEANPDVQEIEMAEIDNRYKPIVDPSDDGNDSDSAAVSDDYEQPPPAAPPAPPAPIRRRVRPTKAPKRKLSSQYEVEDYDEDRLKPNKKPRRPVRPPQKKLNRRRNQNRNQNRNKNRNKNKNRNQNKKRKGNRNNKNRVNTNLKRKPHYPRRGVSSSLNSDKDEGLNVDQGAGTNTITRTFTTTQTGTADEKDVNCIIINKPSVPTVAPTTARPFWDILGRNAGNTGTDRSFGLRKRIKRLKSL